MFAWVILIAAVLVVVVTSVIKNVTMENNTKNLIATVVSVVAGSVAVVVENGGVDGFLSAGLMGTILTVYGAATLIYKFILPDSVDDFLSQRVGSGLNK
jgi:uncharacterized membrane protein